MARERRARRATWAFAAAGSPRSDAWTSPAALVGLCDRGALAPGKKADLNLIDPDALALAHPEIVYDLPAGGKRLVQRARGYRATLVSGEVVLENGEATGALPGKLVRGPQHA